MIKAHKIKLYPTQAQELLLRKSCGVARFSYNWALTKWKELYEAGEKPSAYSLIKLQNSYKKTEWPWMLEVSKTAPQYAIHHVEKAFKKFFNGQTKYPKFKKKGAKDSFVAVEKHQDFNQKDYKLHIPRIGKIKCAENLRFEGKVNNVVVKRIADLWFAVVNVEVPNSTPALKQTLGENQAIVGVDMGIKTLLVLSDGTTFGNPHALRGSLKRLKRLQRGLARKQKGSRNRQRQKIKLARLYYRIACIRSTAIHQATSYIVRHYDKIVIEDLHVQGMAKNQKMARAISDASFGEIARQLTYKAQWQGKELIKADRFFASSKTCSACGHKKETLSLSERVFHCEACGFVCDRDLNAAKNLAQLGATPKSGGSQACGEGSTSEVIPDSPSGKHELNFLTNKKIKT